MDAVNGAEFQGSSHHDFGASVMLPGIWSFGGVRQNSPYRRVSRQPAASASSTEQNQRVPFEICILIWAYQRLVGW